MDIPILYSLVPHRAAGQTICKVLAADQNKLTRWNKLTGWNKLTEWNNLTEDSLVLAAAGWLGMMLKSWSDLQIRDYGSPHGCDAGNDRLGNLLNGWQ